MDRKYPNPVSNHQNFARPAEIYDPFRPNTSIATLSLIDEARGLESAHDLDSQPADDAVMLTVEFVDENAGNEQSEPNDDDDGENDNEQDMEANKPTGTDGMLTQNVNEEEKIEQPSRQSNRQYQKTKDNNNEVAKRKFWDTLATYKDRFAAV